MSLKAFIDDLRKLDVPEEFQDGNNNQRQKLNKLVAVADALKQAAERCAANNTDDTFEAYIEDGGESILYEIHGTRVGD